jgi:hypothetical protein
MSTVVEADRAVRLEGRLVAADLRQGHVWCLSTLLGCEVAATVLPRGASPTDAAGPWPVKVVRVVRTDVPHSRPRWTRRGISLGDYLWWRRLARRGR